MNDDKPNIDINKIALSALNSLPSEEAMKFILDLIHDDTVSRITAGNYEIEVSFNSFIITFHILRRISGATEESSLQKYYIDMKISFNRMKMLRKTSKNKQRY